MRALTDETGIVADTRGYEAFGTMNVEAGNDPLPYRFAGEAFETTSKLAYHRARWMDSRAGRFAGLDPAPGHKRNPASLHRYVYAANDPANLADPSGRDPDMASISAAGIGVGVLSNLGLIHIGIGSVLHGGGWPDAVGFGMMIVPGVSVGRGVSGVGAGFLGVEFVFSPRTHQAGIVGFGALEAAAELVTHPEDLEKRLRKKGDLAWYTSYYFGFHGWDSSNFILGGLAAKGGFFGWSEDEFLVGGSIDPGAEGWLAAGRAGTIAGPWTETEDEMAKNVARWTAAASLANAAAFGYGSKSEGVLVGAAAAAPVNAATTWLWVHSQWK